MEADRVGSTATSRRLGGQLEPEGLQSPDHRSDIALGGQRIVGEALGAGDVVEGQCATDAG